MYTYNINLACSGSGYELDTIIQGPFHTLVKTKKSKQILGWAFTELLLVIHWNQEKSREITEIDAILDPG